MVGKNENKVARKKSQTTNPMTTKQWIVKHYWLFISLFFNSFLLRAQLKVGDKISQLRSDTQWNLVGSVRLQFPGFHPQGMVKVGDYFYLSSVEVTQKRQNNDGGAGIGHLFKFDSTGKLLAQMTLGEGLMYHPGGIDYDGQFIWIPVAEYRPNSRSIIYKVDPKTMKAAEVMRVDEHLGAIVHNTDAHTLHAASWGARNFYRWSLDTEGKPKNKSISLSQIHTENPSFYIDYQDCHYIGRQQMLCGGLRNYKSATNGAIFRLGGLEIVNLVDNRPIFQLPLLLWSPTGTPMTNNPFWIEPTEKGLRAYFVPDDDAAATLWVYEATIK